MKHVFEFHICWEKNNNCAIQMHIDKDCQNICFQCYFGDYQNDPKEQFSL